MVQEKVAVQALKFIHSRGCALSLLPLPTRKNGTEPREVGRFFSEQRGHVDGEVEEGLSVFKLIVNQLFDMYGFNFSRLLGCCGLYDIDNQEFLG